MFQKSELLVLVFLTIVCGYLAQEIAENEETSSENNRDMREFNSDGWRSVHNFASSDSSWIPRDSQQETSSEQIPKRRRLRKRKRRPTTVFSEEESVEEAPLRRRIRPFRLQQVREPWEELQDDEIVRRPYIRRRVTPSYDAVDEESPSDQENVENNQQPLNIGASIKFGSDETTTRLETSSHAQEDDSNIVYGTPKQTTVEATSPKEDTFSKEETFPKEETISNTPNLKDLLKQTGGSLSLSELLQQKNLTLSELLRGNQKAISALTQKPELNLEVSKLEPEPMKYKRLPPSVGLKKNIINRNYEQSEESVEALSSKETLEAQRKRLALLNHNKDSKAYLDVAKFDVVTEPTTEKRIFVPSHPKYYTSVNFKPDLKMVEPTTEPYAEQTTMITTTTEKLIKDLRLVLKPKLKFQFPPLINKFKGIREKEDENYPKKTTPKPIKVNIKDVLEKIKKAHVVEEPLKNKDEPFKVSLMNDTEEENLKNNKSEVFTTNEPEKIKAVTAKEEIMEILKDPRSRDKLSRILETRNMTIEELVEQRERGSSQLHLADIFHNKTKEPEPKEEPFIGSINSEYFNSFPVFGRQQKSIKHDTIKDDSPVEDLNDATEKPKNLYTVTSFPTFKIELNKDKRPKPFLWPDLDPELFPGLHDNNPKPQAEIITTSSSTINEVDEDILRLEEVDNQLSSFSKNQLKVDLVQNNFNGEEEGLTLPAGVKSAIIASLAIVVTSLMVFVTILLIFKLKQKHKARLNYSNSFSSQKIKSPILESNDRRGIRSFMNETLGKKKYYNYNKSHFQTDDIWTTSKVPY